MLKEDWICNKFSFNIPTSEATMSQSKKGFYVRTNKQINKYIENIVAKHSNNPQQWEIFLFKVLYKEVLIDHVVIKTRPSPEGNTIISLGSEGSVSKHLDRDMFNEHVFLLLKLECVTLEFCTIR